MKILQLFLITFFSFGYGQKIYEFDYLVHYSSESNGKIRNLLYYVNSQNPQNYIRILNDGEKYAAKLLSFENNKIYGFDVVKSMKKGEVFYDFSYLSTITLQYNFNPPPFKYIKIDDNNIRLDIFRNKKATKVKQSYLMKIKPYEINLFPAFRIANFHPYERFTQLDYSQNVFVEEATLYCENGTVIKQKVQEIRKINLRITIPKHEKY